MTTPTLTDNDLKLALPKGRMSEGILSLLSDAGIRTTSGSRQYRPSISLPDTSAKVFKPQNVIGMLAHGRRDVGFAGADWVRELQADVVEILDTGLDPVRIVVAGPVGARIPDGSDTRRVTVVSEYERITRSWISKRDLRASFIRSHGATEVFPPDDADLIVDNVSTGSTLKANGLEILETLMESSTRLYASRGAMDS